MSKWSTKHIKAIYSFYIAASENIHQTGLLAGIAVLTVITLLAVTLLFATCVYVRCSHRQQSGLYSTKIMIVYCINIGILLL